MQILVVLGLGIVIYAVFGIFTAGKTKAPQKQKPPDQSLPVADLGKEQKIQRLQSQVAKLEGQIGQAKAVSAEGEADLISIQEKEAEFSVELKRREEWVAKAESELAKTRTENLDLNNKFAAKENELQEEFAKNVNLTRQVREIKDALEAKEMACRLKEDSLQAQKHQIEGQLKSINEHLATIAEFNRKEKISEWVPKTEFNQLNAEYTKLEKELEASQERLKSFAVEIAHLRQSVDKKVSPIEKQKPPEVVLEEIKFPAVVPEEAKQAEIKIEQGKIAEEDKMIGQNIEKKTKEAEE